VTYVPNEIGNRDNLPRLRDPDTTAKRKASTLTNQLPNGVDGQQASITLPGGIGLPETAKSDRGRF
jgi:hypothetical protein